MSKGHGGCRDKGGHVLTCRELEPSGGDSDGHHITERVVGAKCKREKHPHGEGRS